MKLLLCETKDKTPVSRLHTGETVKEAPLRTRVVLYRRTHWTRWQRHQRQLAQLRTHFEIQNIKYFQDKYNSNIFPGGCVGLVLILRHKSCTTKPTKLFLWKGLKRKEKQSKRLCRTVVIPALSWYLTEYSCLQLSLTKEKSKIEK